MAWKIPLWGSKKKPYDLRVLINFVKSIFFNARLKAAKEPEMTSSFGRELQQSTARLYDLKMYFKIIHNLINIDPSKFFQFTPADSKTRGHEYKLRKTVYGNSQFFCPGNTKGVNLTPFGFFNFFPKPPGIF